MAVAQAIDTQYKIVKQSGLGVPGSSGSQRMRRVSAKFGLNKDTYENNEIVDHQQSTGATAGVFRTAGALNALLSPGTYSMLFAALVRKLFTATTPLTGVGITIAGSGPTYTVTRSAGDFLAGGFKIGDIFRLSAGSLDAANLAKNLQIVNLTSTVATVIVLNGSTLTPEGPVTGCTVTVVGKKAIAAASAHTNEYFTIEKWFSQNSKSELYTDVKVASADITIPATGNCTVNFDLPGLARTRGTAEVLTSPSAASTTNVVTAVQGKIVVGTTVTPVTNINIKIDGGIAPGAPEVGSNAISDMTRGTLKVMGSFSAKFTSTTLQDLFDQQTLTSLMVSAADSALANADFVSFVMSAIKVFSDDDDDGNSETIRTYNFTAQINGAGGSALANDNTIISIQDSQAA